MPVKRSRPENSTINLDKTLASLASPICPLKCMKTDAAAEPPAPSVLGASNDGGPDHMKIGGFLERCHYCRRRIPQNSEVFMYSNLCAFCSPECRDFQIFLDRSAEKQPKNPKENFYQGQGHYNGKV